MPPEGEKKRGDTTGEGDEERREPLAEVRARDRRERELETNELGFRRYGAAWPRGGNDEVDDKATSTERDQDEAVPCARAGQQWL